MKKTITVNLNGRVFTIDEDAYRLLDNYLNNLRIYFRKEEGASEIIADFEARIEELLSEKTRQGYQVITIEQVEEVIARVGKPDDFADREDDAKEEKQTNFTESAEGKKRFYRNVDDKLFGGVCSGIAAYFGWDVLVVRIIFIVLLFATKLLIVPFYLAAWLAFPGAFTAEQKLKMRGKPITVENIGKTVAAEKEATGNSRKGCVAGFIDAFVGFIKVLLIGAGCLVGFPLAIVLFVVIVVLFGLLFGLGGGLLVGLPSFVIANHPVLAAITFLLVVGIPAAALVYAIIAHFAKLNPMNRPVKWTFLIIWIVALIVMLSSGFRFDLKNTNWNWKIYESNSIRGNGILSEKTYSLGGPVAYIETGKHLAANLQIEQIQSDTASIVISGDENLIDNVKYDLTDGNLRIYSNNPFRSENNLTIKLRTNSLKGIRSNFVGNIQMDRAFTGGDLEINMSGPSRFQADSLYVNSLSVRSEGIASVDLSGKVKNARLDLSGAGRINAFDLVSDTVYANVRGVGSIQCNPLDYLEGHLRGVGKIAYKEDPKTKNITSEGIGKIGKE